MSFFQPAEKNLTELSMHHTIRQLDEKQNYSIRARHSVICLAKPPAREYPLLPVNIQSCP